MLYNQNYTRLKRNIPKCVWNYPKNDVDKKCISRKPVACAKPRILRWHHTALFHTQCLFSQNDEKKTKMENLQMIHQMFHATIKQVGSLCQQNANLFPQKNAPLINTWLHHKFICISMFEINIFWLSRKWIASSMKARCNHTSKSRIKFLIHSHLLSAKTI